MLANILQEFASPLTKEQVDKIQAAVGDLSLEQVNWLSGYLAGISAGAGAQTLQAATNSDVQTLSAQKPSLSVESTTILYASQTGNARALAEELYEQLKPQGSHIRLADMADYNARQLKNEQQVFVIVSTHGEGEPPDDALPLHEFLFGKKAPDLSHVKFAVLALGDSSYEFFCKTGQDFDERFSELGAQRLFERVDCDVDYRSQAKAWSGQVVEQVSSAAATASASEETKPQLSVVETVSRYSKFTPFSAELLVSQPLTGRGSSKTTAHVEISLEDSGLSYAPGDSLGVWPENHSSLVEQVLAVVGLNGEQEVTVEEQTKRLKEALVVDYELTQISPALVQFVAEKSGDGSLQAIVQERSELNAFIKNHQVIELLQKYPLSWSVEELLGQLRRITPRLYSIASSQEAVDDEVHLTVGLVDDVRDEQHYYGAASRFLVEAEEDQKVRVFVEKNKHFKLPDNGDTDIIMIGAGTGIAPYRGFMQQRESVDTQGRNWLFFGNPHFQTDFLYQLEWQQWLKSGLLSRIDLAFSRDQAHKVYVQHKIKEQGQELFQWLEQGAHLYICGDKDNMAKAVESSLLDVISEYSGKDSAYAEDYLQQLRQSARYQKDVY
ncbi:assimilatory sulfite reductase (NADPH) flavoprotein subunit [Pleionea sp. CnH1-48]|uniref:assimilatory sulfite reductase (NADPH) flavoprotein subunit n=1 Tax=Pleionea sp. CnH1-48 TaxID=2954494 RepID=UPI002097D06E|nr:assimilatory sulfite reductase (NADPH) flavoprotein subunit [Pleionea sp. CnH1-48]MCO7226881.1 assimilatory sulfite reductase (NADPH) flavoprotein subunit [Pleionea sp. CnH1-48]